MSALRASVLMVVLLPMLARAGWRPVTTVTPPVRDVQLLDAGQVLSVSAAGVNVWPVDGGTAEATLAGAFVGGGFYGSCVLGLQPNGQLVPSSGCGTQTAIGPSSGWNAFKLLSSPPFAVGIVTNTTFAELWSGPGVSGAWTRQNLNTTGDTPNRSLQTRQIAGIDYVAMNSGGNTNSVHVSVDGGSALPLPSTVSWRDATPVPLYGAPALLGLNTTGFLLIRDYRDAGAPVIALASPTGIVPRYVNSSGLASMATSTPSGTVLAPIPNPARLLETWVVRSGPPGGLVGKVHCIEDRACVSANDAGVIWLWTNDAPPSVSFVVPADYDAGTLRLIADAGDEDGDPIFVSWDASVPLTSVAGVDDGTQIELALADACQAFTIAAVVTDGLPGHERSMSVAVNPSSRGPLEVSAGATSVPAGAGPVSFTAEVDGGCVPASITWATSDGGTGSGPNFSWMPPRNECNAAGGLVTITATATWASGAPATTSVSRQVVVEPWGPPETPVFVSGSQDAGTTVDWLAMDLGHQCAMSSGFPGTTLHWSYDAGGATVTEIAGGLRITAPQCTISLEVTGTAYRTVDGSDGGQASDAGSLVVSIPGNFVPLDPSNAQLSLSVEGDGGALFGLLTVDAECFDVRSLGAMVTVFTAGNFVTDGGFAADAGTWSWNLVVPGGCAGGTYDVVADLEEDGGKTGVRALGSITLPFTPVNIEAPTASRIDVACGVGARGTVALLPSASTCAAADVQWLVSGPDVVTPSGSGQSFELQSQAVDFSIVGQQLAISWVADAGPGNTDFAMQTIELGVQPFLEVGVKAFPPVRREEQAMTLEVTLTNSTSCTVDGVSVLLPLSGGTAIADSVLLGGAKVASRMTDEGLVVDGVSVPGEGRATLQLSVRPRLLSSPTVEPVATLNGYVVSTRPPLGEPATGCGCSTADLSMMLGVLLIFMRRARAVSRRGEAVSRRSVPGKKERA